MHTILTLVLFVTTMSGPGCRASDPDASQLVQTDPETAAIAEEIEREQSSRRFGIEEPPAKPERAIRIATYNLLNLFDDADDPALSGKNEDLDDTKPRHECMAVARAIRILDADILCVQEIESLAALKQFRDAYLADMGYEHIAAIDAGDGRGIEQAVLSRRPILDAQNWPHRPLGGIHPDEYGPNGRNWDAGKPIVFHRSPLRVEINMGEDDAPEPLTLFVVHHKSGRYSGYWREAESVGVVALIKELEAEVPGRPILVMGDFNAMPSERSVRTYLEAGFDDIFANRPRNDAIVTHESGRRIDLILANRAARAYLLADKAFVLGTAARPAEIDFRDLPTFVGLASDHYPVAVDWVPGRSTKGSTDATP